MQNIFIGFILVILCQGPLLALNMERFGNHSPNFFVHSLDVELHGDLALVTGYGGLMIYDISDNGVEFIDRYNTGGRGQPFYNCKANGNTAYVLGREAGLYIIDISNPRSPSLITRVQFNDRSAEDCDILGDVLVVSLHGDGLVFFDISNPQRPDELATLDGFENCWGVCLNDDGYIFVADGDGGLAVARFSDDGPEIICRRETTGMAIDIRIDGNICAVADGAHGVDLFDISDPEQPAFLSNFDTPTYAGHIGLDGDLVAVADWNEVLVYDISDPEEPLLVGRKFTQTRAMGVDIRGNAVYLADWSRFTGYTYGQIDGPDIEFSTRRIDPVGDGVVDTLLFIYNQGHENLDIRDISCNADEFEADPDGDFSIESGDSIELAFCYQPSAGQSHNMRVRSNDADEGSVNIKLESSGGLSEGDEAPDFTMPLLEGGQYRLSDQRGRVQLLIFWASW